MVKITDGGDAIVAEIEKIRSLYSGDEFFLKFKEYLDTLGLSSEPRDKMCSEQVYLIKNQLNSTQKGSKENLKFLIEIIDTDFNPEDLKIIFEGENYLKELDILKNNDFDLDSVFKTFIAIKDNNFFHGGIENEKLPHKKGLNNLIKKGEIIELYVEKPKGNHKYSHLFTGQLNNSSKMFLNDFFYENYSELTPEKRINIVDYLIK
jgi:hypothetical protein